MKILTGKGSMEVSSEEIAPGLFVTPWIEEGVVVAGWTVSAQAGYSLSYKPFCLNRAKKLAKDLAALGDWSKPPASPSAFLPAGIDRVKFFELCQAATWESFCE